VIANAACNLFRLSYRHNLDDHLIGSEDPTDESVMIKVKNQFSTLRVTSSKNTEIDTPWAAADQDVLRTHKDGGVVHAEMMLQGAGTAYRPNQQYHIRHLQ